LAKSADISEMDSFVAKHQIELDAAESGDLGKAACLQGKAFAEAKQGVFGLVQGDISANIEALTLQPEPDDQTLKRFGPWQGLASTGRSWWRPSACVGTSPSRRPPRSSSTAALQW
jgi:hypothetical protein